MSTLLSRDGLLRGALSASRQGMTFDQYCQMITSLVVSGQTKSQVKNILIKEGIYLCFDVYKPVDIRSLSVEV